MVLKLILAINQEAEMAIVIGYKNKGEIRRDTSDHYRISEGQVHAHLSPTHSRWI